MNRFITPREAAQKLRVGYRTILRQIKLGKIPVVKVGKAFIITEESLQKYAAGETTTKPLEVAVAIVENKGKVLLVQRREKGGRLKWQFPAGIVRYAEKPQLRAEIECLQETGVHCRAGKTFGKRVHPDTHVVISYWSCKFISGKAHNVDTTENSKVAWAVKKKVPKIFTSDTFPLVRKYLET